MAIFDFLNRNNDIAPAMRQALSKRSKSETKKLLIELHEKTELLSRKDLASWRMAWQRAIDVQNPNRCGLYDIYTDIGIDLHITGCIGQRKGFVNKRGFKLVDKSGKRSDEVTALPHHSARRGFMINCQTCAPAYMLRLRGFNITAGENTAGSKLEWLSKHWSKCWKNADGTDAAIITFHSWMEKHGYAVMNASRYMAFFREVCKDPGIYEIGLSWKRQGGHCTIIEKMEDGSLRYIEPQQDNSPGSGREWNNISNLCSRMTTKPYYSRTGIIGVDNQDGIIKIDDKVFDKSLLGIFVK